MPRVRFEPAGVEVDVTPGASMVDVTDDHPEADVPFSCRSASCGTCRVQVEEGLEALNAPGDEEQEVLDLFGDPPQVRLCCQLEVVGEAPRIVLRVVDD
jgi:2Fe-2S ferredoxin